MTLTIETTPRAASPHLATGAVPVLSVGAVTLTVQDAERVTAFYQRVVGLHRMPSHGGPVRLGAGGRVLLELRADPAARQVSPREAGLFHTAFLLPDRPTLAAWLRHAAAIGEPLHGASDHAVSEAVYLSDPEGNGVEVYADRPTAAWHWSGGKIHMPTVALDVQDLLAQDDGRQWKGLSSATVGHVHLRMGDIAQAENFYGGVLGLDITTRYPGGTFYAAGGYHHHLATNVWNSRGAAVRQGKTTGLAAVELLMSAEVIQAIKARAPGVIPRKHGGLVLYDPWNIPLVLTQDHAQAGIHP